MKTNLTAAQRQALLDDVADARAAVKVLRAKLDEAYSAEQAAAARS